MYQKLCLIALLLLNLSSGIIYGKGQTVHVASSASSPIVIDGKLEEEVWRRAVAYPLQVAWRQNQPHHQLLEKGSVRIAWDENYLYIGADLEDVDVVAEDDSDHAHHYRSGDVIEIFLRPPGKRHYWEIYGTPNSRKTVFFFPSRGRLFLPSSVNQDMQIKVAAQVQGTINQWQDKDHGWTLEMAIPITDLTGFGDLVSPASVPWSILICRYNYSAHHSLQGAEWSTTSPSFADANFHNFDVWGRLQFRD